MIGVLNLIRNSAPPMSSRVSSLPLLGMGSTNVEAQMRAYGTVGVLFAIVSRLADTVAAAEWNLYKVGGDESMPNHVAAQVWAQPNTFYSRSDFIETFQQHVDLVGEGIWYVGRNEKSHMPLELWPLRPDRIAPVPHVTKFLEGWVYNSPDGAKIPYRLDEIIQIKRPNPLDPYRGLGPVAAAMVDVYGERAAAEYNATFFKNSAEPGGIIQFEDRLPDEEYDEFVKRWREQHQGVQNAHRVAILERATWIERKYTMRDMQFEALRKLNREFIRQAYGYPKSMLGDTEDVNKAAALAGEYVFKQWMVRPRLDRIKSTLNSRFLPLFGASGQGLEFRYKTPVPEDEELEIKEETADAERVRILVEAGFDPDQVLKFVGLPPIKYIGAAKEPALPADDDEDEPVAPPRNGRGRPRLANDAGARELFGRVKALEEEHAGITLRQLSMRVGVAERTIQRYREAFED